MRPAYGMGRRSFSRPGALRFTVTKWRTNRHGSHPPGRRPSAPSRITPRNRRPPAVLSHNPPEPPRPAIHSGAAPLHNNPRRPAAQPPLHGHPATGHEMADKPARQPPAGPPRPAVPLHNPPGRRPSPSYRIPPLGTAAPRHPQRCSPASQQPWDGALLRPLA